MIGLENVKNKKFRIFKFDRGTGIKNFIHNPGNAILVMGDNLNEAFLISLDGSRKTPAKIKAPENEYYGYLEYSPHALIKNELFIFGGHPDCRKVRKLLKPENE